MFANVYTPRVVPLAIFGPQTPNFEPHPTISDGLAATLGVALQNSTSSVASVCAVSPWCLFVANGVGDDALQGLAEALAVNTSVSVVDLSGVSGYSGK